MKNLGLIMQASNTKSVSFFNNFFEVAKKKKVQGELIAQNPPFFI